MSAALQLFAVLAGVILLVVGFGLAVGWWWAMVLAGALLVAVGLLVDV